MTTKSKTTKTKTKAKEPEVDLYDDLVQEALEAEGLNDHREVSTGGFDMPEPGKAPARFVGYVELGTHPQPDYQGKAKDPARELILYFEIFGSKNTKDVDGVPSGALLQVRQTEKQSSKAKFKQLFDKMRYGRDVAHMSHMLGETFLVTVRHGVSKKSERKYACIQSEDGAFQIGEPVIEKFDDEGNLVGTVDLSKKTPRPSVKPRLFLIDNPTEKQWNSIFIDGTYTKKVKGDDGEELEQEVSKNWMQEQIRTALDWNGSKMQELLGEEASEDEDYEEDETEELEEEEIEELDDLEEEEEVVDEEIEEEEEEEPEVKVTRMAKPAKAAKAGPAKKSASSAAKPSKTATASTATKSPSKKTASKKEVDQSVDDDLAAMGL